MPKIEDTLKQIQEEIINLKKEVAGLKFQFVRSVTALQNQPSGEGGAGGDINIDLGPLEERLDRIEESMITKDELKVIEEKLNDLEGQRIKEAQQTIQRVTQLFERGLELIKLENTLDDIKSLLEETVLESSSSA